MHGRHHTSWISTTGGTRPSGPGRPLVGRAEHRGDRRRRAPPRSASRPSRSRRGRGSSTSTPPSAGRSVRPMRSNGRRTAAAARTSWPAPRDRRRCRRGPRPRHRAARPSRDRGKRGGRPALGAAVGGARARPPSAASCRPSRRLSSRSAPACRSAAGISIRGSRAPLWKPSSRSGVDSRRPDAPARARDRRVSSGARRSVRKPQRSRNAGPPGGQRRLKRVRQQQRRVVRPAGEIGREVARDRAAMLEDDHVSNAVDQREERRTAGRAATSMTASGCAAPDVGDRRQRHHRVAQPVGRDNQPAASHRLAAYRSGCRSSMGVQRTSIP